MSLTKHRFSYLLNKYYEKTATEEESAEFLEILRQSSDDDLTDMLSEDWGRYAAGETIFDSAASEKILTQILQSGKQSYIRPAVIRKYINVNVLAAAAVLVISCLGIYYFNFQPDRREHSDPAQEIIVNDALPGGNRATLRLHDGAVINLDNIENGDLIEGGNMIIKKAGEGRLIFNISQKSREDTPGFNTITTPRGGQYQIVLPDGSKVWMNAASSLKFPSSFTEETREIELEGEAYFEVAKWKSVPFKISAAGVLVEVLGTHFNVMAYEDEASLKTTLAEGSVKVSKGQISRFLVPGNQALFSKNGGFKLVDKVNVSDEIAWKKGIFQYNDTDIQTIMRQVSRWYDLEVSYEGKVRSRLFTGKISRNIKASELLNILEFTGVNFRIEGKKLIVMN